MINLCLLQVGGQKVKNLRRLAYNIDLDQSECGLSKTLRLPAIPFGQDFSSFIHSSIHYIRYFPYKQHFTTQDGNDMGLKKKVNG